MRQRTKQAKLLTLQYSHIMKYLSYPHRIWEITLRQHIKEKHSPIMHTHTETRGKCKTSLLSHNVIVQLIQSTSDKHLKLYSLSLWISSLFPLFLLHPISLVLFYLLAPLRRAIYSSLGFRTFQSSLVNIDHLLRVNSGFITMLTKSLPLYSNL